MRSTAQFVLDGRALLAQTSKNMMEITNYRPRKCGVGTGGNVPPEGVGIVLQVATPFSTSHQSLQTIQVMLVQEPPPCWCKYGAIHL